MRKILGPFALLVGAILLLVAAAYWYEQKYGSTGPFPPQGRGH
jgi:CHASE3 domain sensor protein